MGSSQDYRWFAARCLEIARSSDDPRTQALMLQMAQVWHRLAEESDFSLKKKSSAASADQSDADKSGDAHDPD
jgi:hypothetical protein